MGKHPFLRTAIIFVFLVSFHCIGNANTPHLFNVSKQKSSFTFGPKASFHFNKLHLNRDFVSSFEPGFEGGVFFRLGKRFYIQPELLYSFRHAKFNLLLDQVQTNIDAKNHYLIVPILFGIKLINGERSNIHFMVGPKFAYRVATNTPRFNTVFKPFELGGEVGVGFDLWIFTLDLSYNFYFSQSNREAFRDGAIHQTMYNASLGIKF